MLRKSPLPHPTLAIHPAESRPLGLAGGLLENEHGGVVFVSGQAAYTWNPGEVVTRRFVAVSLVHLGLAGNDVIASAFDVDRVTLWRWEAAYEESGLEGLADSRPGPKGPSKVHPEVVAEILARRREGASYASIAAAVGVSVFSVRRALGRVAPPRTAVEPEVETSVEPEPEPEAGALVEAAPVFTEGRELPLLGLLLVLPNLVQTGLLEAAEGVYGRLHNGFYGLRSMLLTMTYLALLREPRAEGATRLCPPDLGRALGLDRAPEVKTIRRRLGQLAVLGKERAGELLERLARQHAEVRLAAVGLLYLDGHVRVYSGKRRLCKAHITRLRISAPATEEMWVSDTDGDPVFVVVQEPGSSMVKEVRALLPMLREVTGGRRTTICFDRGGWSPELFYDVVKAGFDFITYRKGKTRRVSAKSFQAIAFTDPDGVVHDYLLADVRRRLKLPQAKGRPRTLAVREVVRKVGDHHTVIVTTRTDLSAGEVAYRMFSRWRQENYFKYGRTHFGLDALDSYAALADDPERMVPNPRRAQLQKQLTKARSDLTALEAELGRGGLQRDQRTTVRLDRDVARANVAVIEAEVAQTLAKVPVGDVTPDARVLATELKLITHAVRLSTYNAESALARLLSPFYARSKDEGRALLREAFKLAGSLRVNNGHLDVCLNPLSAPRRTAALVQLCSVLTDTQTVFPGTRLVVRYSVKQPPDVA